MISVPEISAAIYSEKASELRSLGDSPTSKAIVGQLATRAHFVVHDRVVESDFDLYVCRDASRGAVQIPSPFAIVVCSSALQLTPQVASRVVVDAVSQTCPPQAPIVIISPTGHHELAQSLDMQGWTVLDLSARAYIGLHQHRPPRDGLVKRLIEVSSLGLMNPYVYKGPVPVQQFVGRDEQLAKLTRLEHSYALIGPRMIGKTSIINKAYEELRAGDDVAIRVEFGHAISERHLLERIAAEFVDEYGAKQSYRYNSKLRDVEWLIEHYSKKSPFGRVAILIDEADELAERCSGFAACMRTMHDAGTARFVCVGYKQLRKAAYDGKQSDLMNVLNNMPLSRMVHKECSGLITRPMMELGIEFENAHVITETIFQLSGGSPSRVQLFCYSLVQQLSANGSRKLTISQAQRADQIPSVRQELATWYRESTTARERLIAGAAALILPAEEKLFFETVESIFPGITRERIRNEVQDLVTADILDYRANSTILDFSFPHARYLAKAADDPAQAVSELKRSYRRLVNEP